VFTSQHGRLHLTATLVHCRCSCLHCHSQFNAQLGSGGETLILGYFAPHLIISWNSCARRPQQQLWWYGEDFRGLFAAGPTVRRCASQRAPRSPNSNQHQVISLFRRRSLPRAPRQHPPPTCLNLNIPVPQNGIFTRTLKCIYYISTLYFIK